MVSHVISVWSLTCAYVSACVRRSVAFYFFMSGKYVTRAGVGETFMLLRYLFASPVLFWDFLWVVLLDFLFSFLFFFLFFWWWWWIWCISSLFIYFIFKLLLYFEFHLVHILSFIFFFSLNAVFYTFESVAYFFFFSYQGNSSSKCKFCTHSRNTQQAFINHSIQPITRWKNRKNI